MSYKELLALRNARIDRLTKEREAMNDDGDSNIRATNPGLSKEQARDFVLRDMAYFMNKNRPSAEVKRGEEK